jgi:hypothetical protein
MQQYEVLDVKRKLILIEGWGLSSVSGTVWRKEGVEKGGELRPERRESQKYQY